MLIVKQYTDILDLISDTKFNIPKLKAHIILFYAVIKLCLQ